MTHIILWSGFITLVLALLALDLFVLHRKPHEIKLREAIIGAVVPVICALLFSGVVYYLYEKHFLELGNDPPGSAARDASFWPHNGTDAVQMYLTGYLIEISLSADNVFLFVVLMGYFAVPARYQHRVLFWGVVGALVMRAVMIIAGAVLLAKFSWIILVFGVFLLLTGIKMFFRGEEQPDPGKSLAVRLARKVLHVTDHYHEQKFFVRCENGKLMATPLFLVLVAVEFTDVIFAVDSIPAVFAVTYDPFIVFTSNVFAILGLRSMYFLLANVVDKFYLLRYGLAAVLTFVGIKMLLPWFGRLLDQNWHVPTPVSLAVISVFLLASVAGSLAFPKKT